MLESSCRGPFNLPLPNPFSWSMSNEDCGSQLLNSLNPNESWYIYMEDERGDRSQKKKKKKFHTSLFHD